MRITSGLYRGRKLSQPPATHTRPTASRTREAILNILRHWPGFSFQDITVLDTFAGSGIVGLELLSLGAQHIFFMEKNNSVLQVLRQNIATLDAEECCTLYKADTTKPPRAEQAVDLIFMDPPYQQGLEEKACVALKDSGWIDEKTLIVLESTSQKEPKIPEGFLLKKERTYGAARISFLQVSG